MLLNSLFTGVFENSTSSSVSLIDFLLCVGTSLLLGFFLAITYMFKTNYSKSFVVTLATLPMVVCLVIMMVNGNLGAGVAVAGAFSLVRFRSVPGTAKEISAIFIAMGTGLAIGMGYLGYGILFVIIISLVNLLYTASGIGNKKDTQRTMRITIPEDLDYTNVFNDLFEQYTSKYDLLSVKTSNMGSLFKLTYDLNLNNTEEEKLFIDDIRCRNGNLEITMAKQSNLAGEL